jgi:hypothetical protein
MEWDLNSSGNMKYKYIFQIVIKITLHVINKSMGNVGCCKWQPQYEHM